MRTRHIIQAIALSGTFALASCINDLKSQLGLESIDQTPVVFSTTPANAATGIALDAQISISFSKAMDKNSINSRTSGTCAGSVQLSADNFTTCVAMASETPAFSTWAGGQTTATFVLATTLLLETTYHVKLSGSIHDLSGHSLETTSISFTTIAAPPGLGNPVVYTDISAATGRGPDSGYMPSVTVDTAAQKLLTVTYEYSNGKPSLFRCNLDLTGCSNIDISAGQAASSGYTPSAIVDSTNNKLLVVAMNASNSYKPGLFRCNLDGSACTYSDISAGFGDNSSDWILFV